MSPKASCGPKVFLEVARSKVCDAGMKGVWLLSQSTDWVGIVLAKIKDVSATPVLGRVSCIQHKGQKEFCLSLASFYCLLPPWTVAPLLYHPVLEPVNDGLKPLQTVSQINLSSFNFGCQIFWISNKRKVTKTKLCPGILLHWCLGSRMPLLVNNLIREQQHSPKFSFHS